MPRMRWSLAAMGLLACATAQAQPGASDVPPPISPTTPPTPDGSAPMPPPTDPPTVTAEYERGFNLLLGEQWDEAAKVFAQVALQSVDPARSAAASELGRFAREMDDRAEDGPKRTSGRASFVATTTLASFYASFVLDDILAVEDIKAQTMVVTATTLGGFAAALLGSKGKKITESMASGYGSGLLVGAGNGLLLAPRLGISPDGESGDGNVNQNYLMFGLGSMAAGGALAMYLADKYDPTPAQAQFAGLMGINGIATVGLGLAILQPDWDYRNILTVLAVGLDGGVAAGMFLGQDLTWSKSRLTYVTLAEFLGGLTGVAAAVLAVDEKTDDGEKVGAGLVLGGIWGGFALARYMTRDMAPDPRYRVKPQGPSVSLVPLVSEHTKGFGLAGSF